jgi:hypothetical protein
MGKRERKVQVILWSLIFPGAGQWINGRYVKGSVFVLLELALNTLSHFHAALMLSFLGNTEAAVETIDYHWFMFCPCLRFFAAWEAYKEAGEEEDSLSFLPFVLAAFSGTVGIMYSPVFKPFGILLGPIWMTMLCVALGIGIGCLLVLFIQKWKKLQATRP